MQCHFARAALFTGSSVHLLHSKRKHWLHTRQGSPSCSSALQPSHATSCSAINTSTALPHVGHTSLDPANSGACACSVISAVARWPTACTEPFFPAKCSSTSLVTAVSLIGGRSATPQIPTDEVLTDADAEAAALAMACSSCLSSCWSWSETPPAAKARGGAPRRGSARATGAGLRHCRSNSLISVLRCGS